MAVIAGLIVGVVIVLAVAAFFYWRNRSQRHNGGIHGLSHAATGMSNNLLVNDHMAQVMAQTHQVKHYCCYFLFLFLCACSSCDVRCVMSLCGFPFESSFAIHRPTYIPII
jgi:Flp pilus assembly protein TadB